VIRIGGVDKARWLLVVDSLLQVTVKECVLHVELRTMLRTTRIVAGLTTGLKVSS